MEGRTLAKKDIVALLAVYFVYGLSNACSEFKVMYLQGQGMTAAGTGIVLAISSILIAVSRPVAGALADKFRSRKGIFIFAVLLWMTAILGLVFLKGVFIADFLLCAGFVPMMSLCDSVTYGMIEADGVEATLMDSKLDFSLIRIFTSISYCGINFLYTPIVNRFGDRAPFVITAGLLLILFLIAPKLKCFRTNVLERNDEPAEKQKLQFGRLFKNYFLITFVLLAFLQSIGSHTSQYLVYLVQEIGLSGSMIGTASGIRVAGEIIMMITVPFLKNKLSLPLLQAFAGLFQILQLVVYLTCRTPGIILAAVSLSGFAGGITLGTTAVYLRAMAPQGLEATTMALSTIMQQAGGVIMSIAGGAIIDSLGIFSMYRIAICFLIGWFILYFGTWFFGVKVLKKQPVIPMFKVHSA